MNYWLNVHAELISLPAAYFWSSHLRDLWARLVVDHKCKSNLIFANSNGKVLTFMHFF